MGLMTKYVRGRVKETIAAGSSQVKIAEAAGFSRKKLNLWMLRPKESDIQLRTADRIVAACDKIDRTKENQDEQ